jgi:hypothetical protein
MVYLLTKRCKFPVLGSSLERHEGKERHVVGIDAPRKYAVNAPLRDGTQGDSLLCPASIQPLRRAGCEKISIGIFLTIDTIGRAVTKTTMGMCRIVLYLLPTDAFVSDHPFGSCVCSGLSFPTATPQ